MRLDRLALHNFRSYAEAACAFDGSCNILVGENAQGKTNLLESIVLLAAGESPRTRSDREMIRFGESAAFLTGEALSRDRRFRMELTLQAGQKKKLSVNGVAQRRVHDAGEVLSCVYFCPDDLQLIRAGAERRRRFLDEALTQLLPSYGEALRIYRRCYEQKASILRNLDERPSDVVLLPEFSEGMAEYGAVLIHYRARYIAALSHAAAEMHADCSGGREALSLTYETVSSVTDPLAPPKTIYAALREHQQSHEKAELSARQCLSGPHKDDLAIGINGENARVYGSQGQARTAALALKLAERELLREAKEEYPLLLLDDVLSELDPRRQDFVLNRIQGGQVFISCCEEDRLGALVQGRVFRIRGGNIEE